MENKPMKILIIEDDINDCNSFKECEKKRDDIEIVAMTDSDVEGLKLVKAKRPEGIILDLELNNSSNGSIDSLNFVTNLKKLNLNYEPIVMYRKLLMVSQQKSLLHISNLFWLTSCNYNSSKLRKLSYTCYGDLIISLPRLEAIFLKFLYYF